MTLPGRGISNDTDEKETKPDDEFRKMLIKVNPLEGPSSSSYIEMGNTKVICSINGPKERSIELGLDGAIEVTVRGMEESMRLTIESTLKAVIALKKLARTETEIELSVLSDDGGVLAASLMAASVALTAANIECFDLILACQLQVCKSGRLILDPCQQQMKDPANGGGQVTVGMIPAMNQIVCVDSSGTISKGQLSRSVQYGFEQSLGIYPLMAQVLRSHVGVHNGGV